MNRNHAVLIILLFLSHFATAAPQIAPSCKRIFHSAVETAPLRTNTHFFAFDNYTNYNYKDFSKVLFLSDGGKSKYVPAQNRPLNPRHFLSTDFTPQRGVDVVLDNNHLNLYIKSNTFDLIVMNRGLCPCHSPVSCGGIKNSKADMVNFLRQVSRALDKTNSDAPSIALLTGYFWPEHYTSVEGKPLPQTWQEAAYQVAQELPGIQIRSLEDSSGSFIGIAIITSKFVEPSDALNSLNTLIRPD